MSSYTNFKKKLKQYEPFEDIVAEKIISKYQLEPKYEKCITNAYDICLSNGLTYEIKCDVMASKTKHFFIEHYGYKKLSGISTTQANYYVISLDLINFYQISVNELKLLLTSKKYKIVSTKDKLTLGFLVPVDDIIILSELI